MKRLSIAVTIGSCWYQSQRGHIQSLFMVRNRIALKMNRRPAAIGHFAGMAEQAEARNVGTAMNVIADHDVPRRLIELGHLVVELLQERRSYEITLGCRHENAHT